MKAYSDKRSRATPHTIQAGDMVLVKQPKKDKLSPPFNPNPLIVTDTNHSMITAQRSDGSQVTRNSSMFRKMQGMAANDITANDVTSWGDPSALEVPAESEDLGAPTTAQDEESQMIPGPSPENSGSPSLSQSRPKRTLKTVKRWIEEM
jgi:hypothetical protein